MSTDIIIERDPGDEAPEGRPPYPTLVERVYAQALEYRKSVFTKQQGELYGDGDGGKHLLPLPFSPIIQPIFKKFIDERKGKTPTCATVPPGSSPPLTPPPKKSEPAADAPATPPPAQPAPASTGKGSKGSQTKPGAVQAARKKRAKLRAGLRP